MVYEAVGKIVDKWMNDTSFRAAFRKNPEETIRNNGFSITEEELKILKKIDWTKSDKELESLISKPALI